MIRKFTLIAGLICAPQLALASDPVSAMQSFLDEQVATWSQNTVLVEAIVAQNGKTNGYDAGQIDMLDQTWRAEVGTASDLVDSVLLNDAADFLRMQVDASGGMITEVFIMDSVGLNVAASSPTSDYWQGDEAKFQKTYPMGADAVHFSEIEFDESSQSYQAQLSLTINDASGTPVGAMTVGINADSLM